MPGLETYTQADLDRLVKMLSSGEGEKQLMSWIQDWVARQFAVTQASQIIGTPLMLFNEAPPVETEESTTSATFGNLTTIGPTLSGMADGNWILIWGCLIRCTGADSVGEMGISPSWAGTSDSHVAQLTVPVNTQGNACYSRAFGTQGPAVVDASGKGNSSATAVYRRQSGTGTVFFKNRWLVAVRTGPATPGN